MTEKTTIRDAAALQQWGCRPGRDQPGYMWGEIALDALGHATAEDLLAAFRGSMPEQDAKVVVQVLLDNGLTFDSAIDFEVDWLAKNEGGTDAR
jgi:hypothetical protein